MVSDKRVKKSRWKNLGSLVGCICFLLCFAVILSALTNLLVRKSLTEPWNMSLKVGGFYNEPENSMDVMYFGSSHMYCSVNPVLMEELTGLSSYVLATQSQPVWVSYYYMKEALKTQNPKTVVMEVHMAIEEEEYAEEGTLHSAIDPVPLSKNKIEMVYAAVPDGERRNYIFNIIKYHTRWEELTKEDYTQEYLKDKDAFRGYVPLPNVTPIEERADLTAVTEIDLPLDKTMTYFNKIIDLAEAEGFQLIFLKSPSNATVEEKMKYNAVEALAKERGVPFVDYNLRYEEVGLDPAADFYDQRHLNEAGMKKFVPHFAQYLN